MNVVLRYSLLLALLMLNAACTRMPAEYMAAQQTRVSPSANGSQLMHLVGSATMGMPQTHIDAVTGLSSVVTVTSEYFSANGRNCRRFSQHMSNASVPQEKLGCYDKRAGWQEIPIAGIVD